MSIHKKKLPILAIISLSILLSGSIAAQVPSLIITVGDAVVPAGTSSGYVTVHLENTTDSVIGFQLWLQASNPEIIQFTPAVDTAGTLISGWGAGTTSLSGLYYDLLITATSPIPYYPLAIAPQSGGTLLRLPVTVQNIPDTATLRSVDIMVQHNVLDHFNFVAPGGISIGIITDSILDTSYYYCDVWAGEECLVWTQVPEGQPFDSMEIDWILIATLDTNAVQINDGSFTIAEPILCGDMDASGANDISDLTYFVAYLFLGGAAPPLLITADCNGDGNIDISDLTCYVCYLFQGCLPPDCL